MCRVLAKELFLRYGVSLKVVRDQSREFENRFLRELCDGFGIDNVRTNHYNTPNNSTIERLQRTVNEMLGRVIEESYRDWDLKVSAAMAAYRVSLHEPTGY